MSMWAGTRSAAGLKITVLPIFRLAETKVAPYLPSVERVKRADVIDVGRGVFGSFVMRIGNLLVATAMGLLAGPALGADIGPVEALPTPEVSVAEPANDWSGFYLGALLGYSWGDSDTSRFGDVESDGVDGGGYVGATWQYGNLVIGAEGDVMASGLEGAAGPVSLDQGVNGSLRARAGIALDQFLLYGTAGAAVTDVEMSGFGDTDDAALWGWTAGAGAEAMIFSNVTARVEYRYTDYEDETFTLGGQQVDSDLSTHSIRAGVGVQF